MIESELRTFREGDRAVFRRLVEELSPRLLFLALRYTGDDDEAHDVVQEVWTKAFEHRHQLESAGALEGWLTQICHRVCLTRMRRGRVREQGLESVAGAAPSPAESPDAFAGRTELRDAVAAAVAELAPRQREVVLLRLLRGLSTKETAHQLGCAEGTVKAALHQALKNLNPKLRSWRDAFVS